MCVQCCVPLCCAAQCTGRSPLACVSAEVVARGKRPAPAACCTCSKAAYDCSAKRPRTAADVTESAFSHAGAVPSSAGPALPNRVGPFLIGPSLGNSPVKSISHCLARKEGTDLFYSIKILTVKCCDEESRDDRQGRMLLHTEHALLSLLRNQDGVIQQHGLYQDVLADESAPFASNRVNKNNGSGSGSGATSQVQRLALVLDCLGAHPAHPVTSTSSSPTSSPTSSSTSSWSSHINLHQYVVRRRRLAEPEALLIFRNVVRVVARLHAAHIVHRDLKLGNIMLHRRAKSVVLTNFCLGKQLSGDGELLQDQRGSPAYISPDVLSGQPYHGKPSDMWALGVVLFTMLYGQFPFYDAAPQELFRKIRSADYTIPEDVCVSPGTVQLLRWLLQLQPTHRITADQVLQRCFGAGPASLLHQLSPLPAAATSCAGAALGAAGGELDDDDQVVPQMRSLPPPPPPCSWAPASAAGHVTNSSSNHSSSSSSTGAASQSLHSCVHKFSWSHL